jgi:hypothetical protein
VNQCNQNGNGCKSDEREKNEKFQKPNYLDLGEFPKNVK